MPLDGNGNYTLPAGVLGVPGELISSAPYNALLADIQAVLNLVLYRDGQAAATGDLNMGNHKVVTAAAGLSANDLITKAQLTAATDPGTGVSTVLENGKITILTSGITIPIAPGGTFYQVFNNSASTVTLTQGAGLSMLLSATPNSGNRTLAVNGWASIFYLDSVSAIIAGIGLS